MTAPTRSTTLRLLVALALCLGVVAACSDDDNNGSDDNNRSDTTDDNGESGVPSDWDIYTDDDTGFRFAMPGQPEVIIDVVPQPDGDSLEATLHVVESPQGLVLVGFSPVPTAHDLDIAVDRAAGEVDGTIIDRSTVTVEGHDARDAEATFETGGQAGLMLIRILVIDDTVIQLSTIGATDAERSLRSRHEAMLAGFEY